MFEATYNEFPFMAEVSKKEKGKLAKLWDYLEQIKSITDEKGPLLPAHFVAKLLDLSNQRISQLVQEEKLESFEIDGRKFITEASVTAWAQAEHKAGRPVINANMTTGQVWKKAYGAAKEWVSDVRKGEDKK